MDATHVYLHAWAYQYPNLLEGADRIGGQLRGDKECPFSGITKSGRVWRKVLESNARSVLSSLIGFFAEQQTTNQSTQFISHDPLPQFQTMNRL